jgi:hypothetical protein
MRKKRERYVLRYAHFHGRNGGRMKSGGNVIGGEDGEER